MQEKGSLLSTLLSACLVPRLAGAPDAKADSGAKAGCSTNPTQKVQLHRLFTYGPKTRFWDLIRRQEYISMYVYIYAYTCVYVFMCMYDKICQYTYLHLYIYIYVYIHVYICVHAFTYYVHMNVCSHLYAKKGCVPAPEGQLPLEACPRQG